MPKVEFQEGDPNKALKRLVLVGKQCLEERENILRYPADISEAESKGDTKQSQRLIDELKRKKVGISNSIGGEEREDIDYNDVLFQQAGFGRDLMDKCRSYPGRDYPYNVIAQMRKHKDKPQSSDYYNPQIELQSLVERTFDKCQELGDFYAFDQLMELVPKEGINLERLNRKEKNESNAGSVLHALKEINLDYQGGEYERIVAEGEGKKPVEGGEKNFLGDRERESRIMEIVNNEIAKSEHEFEENIRKVPTLGLSLEQAEKVQKEMGLSGMMKNIEKRLEELQKTTVDWIKSFFRKQSAVDGVSGKQEVLPEEGREAKKNNLVIGGNGLEMKGENTEETQKNERELQEKIELMKHVVHELGDMYSIYKSFKKNKDDGTANQEDIDEMIRSIRTIKEFKKELGKIFLDTNTTLGERATLKLYEETVKYRPSYGKFSLDQEAIKSILQGEIPWMTKYTSMTRGQIEDILGDKSK